MSHPNDGDKPKIDLSDDAVLPAWWRAILAPDEQLESVSHPPFPTYKDSDFS